MRERMSVFLRGERPPAPPNGRNKVATEFHTKHRLWGMLIGMRNHHRVALLLLGWPSASSSLRSARRRFFWCSSTSSEVRILLPVICSQAMY